MPNRPHATDRGWPAPPGLPPKISAETYTLVSLTARIISPGGGGAAEELGLNEVDVVPAVKQIRKERRSGTNGGNGGENIMLNKTEEASFASFRR